MRVGEGKGRMGGELRVGEGREREISVGEGGEAFLGKRGMCGVDKEGR